MIAAAARTSGTRSPAASTLYRGRAGSAISRAIATARADASFCFRVWARAAEYAAVFFFAVFAVAASAGPMPILTRLKSARGPTQKAALLITRGTPDCKLMFDGLTV